MPIYTYRCENCGVQFERQQSFNDETLKRCPECNKNKLRRVITPAGIVFKGSGWYVTDSKSKSSTASTPMRNWGATIWKPWLRRHWRRACCMRRERTLRRHATQK